MTEWLYLVIYMAGFGVTCRLLARHAFIPEDGLLIVGVVALFWPLLAVVIAVVAPFAGLVWLATRGVKR